MWCLKQVDDWQVANNKQVTTHTHEVTTDRPDHKWKKPGEGQLKINVDASVVEGQGFFEVGMVIRDHHGQFIPGKTLKLAGGVSVTEAESTGILEALIWAQDVTEGTVLVESDSLLSVNAIKQNQSNLLELGDLVQQCGELLKSNDRIFLSHVKKQRFKVAYTLARFPCALNSFIVFSSPPSVLLETLVSADLLS